MKKYLLSLLLCANILFAIQLPASISPVFSTGEHSPTGRFLSTHPYKDVKKKLQKFDLLSTDETLFTQLVSKETTSFIGYHASSTDFLVFQDILKVALEEVMDIPIPKHFHFFRNPLDSHLVFETAAEFTTAMPIPKSGKDDLPEIRQHLLSLNIALFQSYDSPWNLTPSYYLENRTWTKPVYPEILEAFFDEIGLNPNQASFIYDNAKQKLPTKRGVIYQFFIKNHEYDAIDSYFYLAKSGGALISEYTPTQMLFDYTKKNFPQLRMIFNPKTTLNPYHKIEIHRYDNLTKKQRKAYETLLREELKSMSVQSKKLNRAKKKLLKLWNQNL